MMENQNVRLAVTFIIGLIVGVGGYWLVAHRGTQYPNDTAMMSGDEIGSTTDQAMVMQGSNGVSVQDQAPGNSVTVSQIVLKNPGWVAIHDDDNGVPGKILGAKLFDKGTSNGVIPLLRNTVSGKSYIAVIHSDDGDYHNFTPKTDKILMDSNGNMVMTTFKVGDTNNK